MIAGVVAGPHQVGHPRVRDDERLVEDLEREIANTCIGIDAQPLAPVADPPNAGYHVIDIDAVRDVQPERIDAVVVEVAIGQETHVLRTGMDVVLEEMDVGDAHGGIGRRARQ